MHGKAPGVSAEASFLSAIHETILRAQQGGVITRSFEVAGMPVEVRCLHSIDPATLDRFLGALSAGPRRTGGTGEPLTIMLWEIASANVALPGMELLPADRAVGEQLLRFCDARYTMLYKTHGRVLSSYDAEKAVGFEIIPDFAGLPQYVWASPMRELLGWNLSQRNRPLVHASAITGISGGALLVGPSGSGKSTTAALCSQFDDLAFVADDFCAVSLDGGRPKVHSIFKTAKLMPRWQSSMPNLGTGEFCEDMGKTVYNIAQDRVCTEAAIKCIYLPVVEDIEHSRLSIAGPGVAMRRLAPSTLFQHTGTGPHEMRLMAELVRRVPAFELRLGRDTRQLAQLVTSHLNGLP